MKSPYVGEIIGFRQEFDRPLEVLVRTQRPVYVVADYFGRREDEKIDYFSGYEWDSEWRLAHPHEIERMKEWSPTG